MIGTSRDQQTICAVSTPHGVGGISVIRVSGPKAIEIVRKIATFIPNTPESHRAYYGKIKYLEGSFIDEAVLLFFAKGRSFTGEDVFEISCHGSPFICQEILSELVLAGASIADRGEFTYRAFMNGRLDLVQAESVLAMIESQTKSSSELALRQLEGHLSKELLDIEDKLVWLLANFEASIDFSTEGIDVLDFSVIDEKLTSIRQRLATLVSSYKVGKVVKDGFKIALVGRPNVGKSSLLNLLLQEDRAIVTDIPGTTRDVLSGETVFEGQKFTFLDTAGIRQDAVDQVEHMGIQRSHLAIQDADLVMLVIEAGKGLVDTEEEILRLAKGRPLIVLQNKADLLGDQQRDVNFLHGTSINALNVSAFDKKYRNLILGSAKQRVGVLADRNSAMLSQVRHFENLSKALENADRSAEMVASQEGAEFLAFELKEALLKIQETLGKRFDDQIMDRVFKEFCIGK